MNELTAYCESLQNCINYIDETVLKKLYFTGEYKSEPKRFYFFLLFNANKRLDAFNELISKIHDKSHYANCAFLILRPILLDLIMMDYISFKSGLNDNKVDEEKLLEYIAYSCPKRTPIPTENGHTFLPKTDSNS